MSNISLQVDSAMTRIDLILLQIFIPYTIIVGLIGIAGNVLTIIMLSKRSLTKNFNNCTLIALALTDLLFNLALLLQSLSHLPRYQSSTFCRILSFISHLAELLSACFTAHFTIQRFIAVKFPLSVFVEKKLHLLHYIIVTLFILFGVSYCLALINFNRYYDCKEALSLGWFISDALSSFVVPFTIIAVLNLLIIIHLRQNSRYHQPLSLKARTKNDAIPLHSRRRMSISLDSNSQSTRLSENNFIGNLKASMYRFPSQSETTDQFLSVSTAPIRTASIRSTTRTHAQSHRVTRMLILVSTCFLVLNAPTHICSIASKVHELKQLQLFRKSQELSRTNRTPTTAVAMIEDLNLPGTTTNQRGFDFDLIFYITVITCMHISYLSYSINFFLYSFCGMKFRRELMRFLSPFGKCRRRFQSSRAIRRQNS